MSKLPLVQGRAVVAVLVKIGYCRMRQRGSHLRLEHPILKSLTIPIHNRPLKKGTLHRILKDAELSVDDFLTLL